MSQTLPERVNAYITKGRPDAYCDDCVAAGLELRQRQQVYAITSTLATTDCFDRSIGECAICGKVKTITSRA